MKYLLKKLKVVNEGEIFEAELLIDNGIIASIIRTNSNQHFTTTQLQGATTIDLKGQYLFPGIIDDQVHFREPGLTHKGDIHSESAAAAAGGITSFMEMPNTLPNATSLELLEQKYAIASEKSYINYSFFLGASNDNIKELQKTDPNKICGIKLFMGSSTGNMLVNRKEALRDIFSIKHILIAIHCEDEEIIKTNTEFFREQYGENPPWRCHSEIRSAEACYRSSSNAIELAEKYGARIHILHVSTGKETGLFRNDIPIEEKRVTSEVCIHHLWFCDEDYERKQQYIKWNPSIKTASDREQLFEAMLDDRLDIIATDHAPHTKEEKSQNYFKSPAGGPLVQHSLVSMLEFYHQCKISLEKIVDKMCHRPARLFSIRNRGFIREGYQADLCVVDLDSPWIVSKENILYKCGWSPFEGNTFKSAVTHTFINGQLVFEKGKLNNIHAGERIKFN